MMQATAIGILAVATALVLDDALRTWGWIAAAVLGAAGLILALACGWKLAEVINQAERERDQQ